MVERRGITYRNLRGDVVEGAPSDPVLPAPMELRPVGGDPTTVRLIGGMDGVISSVSAAAQELRDAAKELRILNERHLRMRGQRISAEGEATGGITQQGLVDAFNEVVHEQTQALIEALPKAVRGEPVQMPDSPGGVPSAPSGPSGAGRPPWVDDPTNPYQYPPGEEPPEVPSAPSGGRKVSPASRGEVDPTDRLRDGVDEADPEGPAPSPWEQYQRRRDFFGGKGKFSVGNLRQTLGQRATEGLSQRTWGEQLLVDPLGNWRHAPADDSDYGDLADEAAIAGFHRREKITGAVRTAASTLAEGGTFRQAGMNMLPAGAARALGVAGAALYAVDKVGDFAESQRAQNASWQRMQGGGNFAGFGERLGSKMFGLSQFGVMGENDAALLYQEAAKTGMSRDQRRNAVSFGVENYKEFGMTITQSMEIVKTAALTGQESLRGFRDSLRSVTDAAREAGVNTEVARQRFVDTWQSFSETLSGPTSVAVAGGLATAQAGLGRRYTDLDFTGAADTDQMRMLAAQRGQTFNQFLAESSGPGGEIVLAQAIQDNAQRQAQIQLGERGMQIVAQHWEGRSGQGVNGGFTDVERQALTRDVLENVPHLDVPTLIQVMEQMTGVSGLDVNDAIGYVASLQTGEFDAVQAVEAERERGRTESIDPRRSQEDITADPYTGVWSEEYLDLEQEVNDTRSGWRWGDRDDRRVTDAYLQDVRRTGRRGGISEAIATDPSSRASIERVEVETSGGPRIVTLDEAMIHFRDQIDQGTAVVAEGASAGVTVSEVVGMVGDDTVTSGGTNTSVIPEGYSQDDLPEDATWAERFEHLRAAGGSVSGTANIADTSQIGESPEEAAARRREEGGGGGGTVTISPTPELQRFFQFTGSGNVNVDPAAGWRPPPSHITPGARPSGSPGP
jgi:hypothetical protein